jgi:hypothetical protein
MLDGRTGQANDVLADDDARNRLKPESLTLVPIAGQPHWPQLHFPRVNGFPLRLSLGDPTARRALIRAGVAAVLLGC